MRLRSVAAGLAAVPLAALAGCGHSAPTTFLVIDPAPPAASAPAYRGPPLRVPFLHVPVTLDRPELTRQDAAGTLVVDDFARWSAPLGLMARNVLIQDLVARLPAGSVLPPDAPAAPHELRVEVTVLSFVATAGQATMTVEYRMIPPGRAVAPARPQVAQFAAAVPGDDPAGRARAWSALIGELSDRLVADLPR